MAATERAGRWACETCAYQQVKPDEACLASCSISRARRPVGSADTAHETGTSSWTIVPQRKRLSPKTEAQPGPELTLRTTRTPGAPPTRDVPLPAKGSLSRAPLAPPTRGTTHDDERVGTSTWTIVSHRKMRLLPKTEAQPGLEQPLRSPHTSETPPPRTKPASHKAPWSLTAADFPPANQERHPSTFTESAPNPEITTVLIWPSVAPLSPPPRGPPAAISTWAALAGLGSASLSIREPTGTHMSCATGARAPLAAPAVTMAPGRHPSKRKRPRIASPRSPSPPPRTPPAPLARPGSHRPSFTFMKMKFLECGSAFVNASGDDLVDSIMAASAFGPERKSSVIQCLVAAAAGRAKSFVDRGAFSKQVLDRYISTGRRTSSTHWTATIGLAAPVVTPTGVDRVISFVGRHDGQSKKGVYWYIVDHSIPAFPTKKVRSSEAGMTY